MLGNISKNSLVERSSRLAPLAVPRRVLQSVNRKENVSEAEKQQYQYHSASNMSMFCVTNNNETF